MLYIIFSPLSIYSNRKKGFLSLPKERVRISLKLFVITRFINCPCSKINTYPY